MKNKRDHPRVIAETFPLDPAIYKELADLTFNYEGHQFPWSSLTATAQVTGRGGAYDELTTGYLMYALSQFYLSGEPYWRLDEDLAICLARTDPPIEVLQTLPRAPFDGMYIEIPAGVFNIQNKESGSHDAIGIYVAKDFTLKNDAVVGCLCLVAAGESKGTIMRDGYELVDDALVYGKWLSADDVMGSRFHDIAVAWRIVANLLIALQNKLVDLCVHDPLKGKKTKKVKRLLRQGARKVTELSLRASPARSGSASEGSGRSVKAHLRRGHWRSQWVKEPGDRRVYETKKREDRPDLHKVLLWIHPTRVGKGDAERKVTRVRR